MKHITLRSLSRLKSLLPNNYPRYVRVYDAGPDGSADRYTVVFTGRYNLLGRHRGERKDVEYWYIGMSADPFHPQGFCHLDSSSQTIDVDEIHHRWPPSYGKTGKLGKRIHWHELPAECQKAALHAYKELWDLYPAEAKDGKIKLPARSA